MLKSRQKKKKEKECKERLGLDQKTFDDIKRTFDTIDRDGNGSISHEEFKQVMAQHNTRPSDREIQEMLEKADKDNSGGIDFEEFASMMAIKFKEKTDLDIQIKELFKSFDTNKDGFLGRREIQAGFQSLKKRMITDAEADEIIRTADKDEDGVLCLSEFIQYVYDNN